MRVPTPKKLPSGNWFVQVRQGGQSYSFTGKDKDKVLAEAVAFKAGVAKKKKLPLTIGEAVDNYIDSMDAVLSPSTVRGYRNIRRNRFQAFADIPLDRFDRKTAQRMVNEEAKKYSPKTVKNAWRLFSSALKMYDIYPGQIALPAVQRPVRPFLDVSQVDRFLHCLRGKPWEIPALLALHGLRRSELYALDWQQVDLDKDTITVNASVVPGPDGFIRRNATKTTASYRAVPIIIPRLLELLKDGGEGPVVTSHPNTLYDQVNATCREAGVPQVGVHGLRHTFASLCYAAGVDMLTTAQLGGWSTSDLTTLRTIYTHLSQAQYNEGVEKLKKAFR